MVLWKPELHQLEKLEKSSLSFIGNYFCDYSTRILKHKERLLRTVAVCLLHLLCVLSFYGASKVCTEVVSVANDWTSISELN